MGGRIHESRHEASEKLTSAPRINCNPQRRSPGVCACADLSMRLRGYHTHRYRTAHSGCRRGDCHRRWACRWMADMDERSVAASLCGHRHRRGRERRNRCSFMRSALFMRNTLFMRCGVYHRLVTLLLDRRLQGRVFGRVFGRVLTGWSAFGMRLRLRHRQESIRRARAEGGRGLWLRRLRQLLRR
jgi:hypothetical protein